MPVHYPRVQLVAAPVEGAALLYDFNAGDAQGRPLPPGRWILRESFTLGAPTLEGDVDSIDQAYGRRIVEFKHRIGQPAAVARGVLSAVSRALTAGRSWLRVQLTADQEPMWLRTYVPEPRALSLDNAALGSSEDTAADKAAADNGALWDLDVAIPCAPFGIGLPKAFTVSVPNNPLAVPGSPLAVTLPEIQGDAPAPLRLAATFSEFNTSGAPLLGLVGTLSGRGVGGVAAPLPVFLQAGTGDGATVDASVTTESDSSASGGSARLISFTNPVMFQRIAYSNVGGAEGKSGRYRILARVRSGDSSVFRLRVNTSITKSTIVDDNQAVTVRSAVAWQWVDLGLHSMPFDPPPIGEAIDPTATTLALGASRVSGTGSLRVDGLLAIPVAGPDTVDATVGFVRADYVPTSTGLVIDAAGGSAGAGGGVDDSGATWTSMAAGATGRRAVLEGAYPYVAPGVGHALVLVRGMTLADNLTGSTSLECTYRPQWLHGNALTA